MPYEILKIIFIEVAGPHIPIEFFHRLMAPFLITTSCLHQCILMIILDKQSIEQSYTIRLHHKRLHTQETSTILGMSKPTFQLSDIFCSMCAIKC